ncbi:MAG: class I SAM-dependent methyltransferase [Dehalococcoidia bacterium]
MAQFPTFFRVTSDSKPWRRGGQLGVCERCGLVQKQTDDAWRAETADLYADYTVYHQGGGAEQAVFGAGGPAPRSLRLLEQLIETAPLAASGRMLDLGCGNGGMLRSFHQVAPGWRLAGSELDDRNRIIVEAIPGVDALFVGPIETIPGPFDLISMVHLIEHIEDPTGFLRAVAEKLAPGGLLLIETPNLADNPIDLVIADHCTHFTEETLRQVLGAAGFETVHCATDWIPKELSILARPLANADAPTANPAAAGALLNQQLRWLTNVVEAARRASERRPFGLFGATIGATWLFGELDGQVDFFVDEDPARAGRNYLGRPVLTPAEVSGGTVFVGMPTPIAQTIANRLTRSGVAYLSPPA